MLIYRLLAPFLCIAQLLRGGWLVLCGHWRASDVAEMLRGGTVSGPVTWVHAASVGEANAAKPVIAHLAKSGGVHVTTTTPTGRQTVANWAMDGVSSSLAPVDLRWLTARFLIRAQVTRLVIVENELWPNRIMTCHTKGVPVVLINARMSARSARVWARFGRTARKLLAPMQVVAPQDSASAARLHTLGTDPARTLVPINLKARYTPMTRDIPAELKGFTREDTFLAASTHEGEDKIALQAFAIARKTRPDLRLIIAPRHPTRASEVRNAIASAGFDCAQRSLGQPPARDVYLADTLGEMDLWFRVAGATFLGGSLVPKGGHTPFEPAAYDCPILHGPHVANFTEDYAHLHPDGAIQVHDAMSLAAGIGHALGHTHMAKTARSRLAPPDLSPLLDALD